jgi:hypothetical protein
MNNKPSMRPPPSSSSSLVLSGDYYRNFVNAIRAEYTRQGYIFVLKKYMTYLGVKDCDQLYWHARFDISTSITSAAASGSGSSHDIVDHAKLQQALISNNRFFSGDALLMIESMLRTGKIIEVGFHKYKKR